MLFHNRSHPLGDMDMTKTRFLATVAAVMMVASPVLAQTAQPVTPSTPTMPARPVVPAPAAPAAAQPAMPARPTTPAAAQPTATTPAARVININTATAAELDTLKGIGPARAKKIVEERAKTRFRNFDDLVQRNVLPSNVEADLRGKISF